MALNWKRGKGLTPGSPVRPKYALREIETRTKNPAKTTPFKVRSSSILKDSWRGGFDVLGRWDLGR